MFTADLVNGLNQARTVHWHGLRLPVDEYGAPGLLLDLVTPGARFRYAFTPPDTGIFWYHPHCNTLDQMSPGMTGLLVVREPVDPGFDVDLPVNLRDFRLGFHGQFIELFKLRNSVRGHPGLQTH